MIQAKTITAYFAPTKGKTYITKAGAIKAETHAIIMRRHPWEGADHDDEGRCTYRGWHIQYDEPERYDKMFRRLRRIVAKNVN
jgi:hypothetical protein